VNGRLFGCGEFDELPPQVPALFGPRGGLDLGQLPAGRVADQTDRVALGVGDERHPLVGPSRAQSVVVVAEDHVRLGLDGHTLGAQPLYGRTDIGHREIEQGTRSGPIEQQPDAVESVEQQSRRIEDARGFLSEQAGVEDLGAGQIVGVLGYLDHIHEASPIGSNPIN